MNSFKTAIIAAAGAGMSLDIVKVAEILCEIDKRWIPDVAN